MQMFLKGWTLLVSNWEMIREYFIQFVHFICVHVQVTQEHFEDVAEYFVDAICGLQLEAHIRDIEKMVPKL